MTEFITLDWKNSIIQSEFSGGGQNIKIKENQVDNNKCYIYFSSNDLYHKDSEPDFKKKIVEILTKDPVPNESTPEASRATRSINFSLFTVIILLCHKLDNLKV